MPYETVVIDLADRPAWLYEKNPAGKVPVLEETACASRVGRDHGVARGALSRAALLPSEPAERALVRLAVWRFDDEFSRDYYAARRGDDGADERFASCLAALDPAQRVAFACPSYTLADIAWFPWLPRPRRTSASTFEDYPAIAAWRDRLAERPAIAAEIDVVVAPGERASSRRQRGVGREHGLRTSVLLADVRGPNAHARGHLPGSIPLVVGAPGQFTDPASSRRSPGRSGSGCAAQESPARAARALRRGRCVAAASAVQAIELAGHPGVAVLAGGLAAWQGEVDEGAVVLDKSRIELEPKLDAFPTLDELRGAWTIPRSRSSTSAIPRSSRGGRSAVRSAPGPAFRERGTSRSRRSSRPRAGRGRSTR